MLPDPLHPAVVHLARAWAGIVLLQALLVGSAWLAMETGEREEERVERVVAERHIEDHEEAAERFLWVAGVALVALAAGLLPAGAGRAGRLVGTAAALGVLAAGVAVGHSGGELVYRHGAASAYVDAPDASPAAKRQRHD
jgi:hypothetical protein